MELEIVRETKQSLLEYLPKVIDETKRAAEYFHTDREATGLKSLATLTDAYRWVLDAVNGIKNNGGLEEISLKETTDFLREIEEALSIQDYIAVSDLLEYEILEILEKWYGIILEDTKEK